MTSVRHTFRARFLNDEYSKGLARPLVSNPKKNRYVEAITFAGPFPSTQAAPGRAKVLICDPKSGSASGVIGVTDEGRTKFTASANGRHRYLVADPEQRDRIVKLYAEVASAKPVPRPQRVPGKQQQQHSEGGGRKSAGRKNTLARSNAAPNNDLSPEPSGPFAS